MNIPLIKSIKSKWWCWHDTLFTWTRINCYKKVLVEICTFLESAEHREKYKTTHRKRKQPPEGVLAKKMPTTKSKAFFIWLSTCLLKKKTDKNENYPWYCALIFLFIIMSIKFLKFYIIEIFGVELIQNYNLDWLKNLVRQKLVIM